MPERPSQWRAGDLREPWYIAADRMGRTILDIAKVQIAAACTHGHARRVVRRDQCLQARATETLEVGAGMQQLLIDSADAVELTDVLLSILTKLSIALEQNAVDSWPRDDVWRLIAEVAIQVQSAL